MLASSADHNKFAPPASSPGACAKGGRRSPLLASAATPSIIDNQHQTDSHSRGGAPLGLRCDYRPAVGGTSRRVSFIRALGGYDLPDCNLAGAFIGAGPFGKFDGIGRRSNAILASINYETADHLLHYRAEPLKRHFSFSVRYAQTGSELGDRKIGNSSQAGQR